MKIKDVLIFKQVEGITNCEFKNPLPLSFNFNYNQQIGEAILTQKEDGIYADIEVFEPFALNTVACATLFPYLGGIVDRELKLFKASDTAIGIYPNQDETIPMIDAKQIEIVK